MPSLKTTARYAIQSNIRPCVLLSAPGDQGACGVSKIVGGGLHCCGALFKGFI